jgi:Domain of unknown function (DUF4173)
LKTIFGPSPWPGTGLRFAQSLQGNLQILNISDKRPAKWLGMVGLWQKSLPFPFDDHGFQGGYSGTAGGWCRLRFRPPSLSSPGATLRSAGPPPRPDTLPSSIPGNEPMSIATASDFESTPARPCATPLVLAIICVAAADWLFYGCDIGISLAIFLGVLGVVAIFCNRVYAERKTRIIMTGIFVAGLLALAEDVDLLSVTVGALAMAMFVIVITSRPTTSWQRQLFEAVSVPFRGPFRLIGDTVRALRHMADWTPGWLGWLVGWIVPLSVFAVFLALFSSANPLIEYRLMQVDLRKLFVLFDFERLAFWFFIAAMIWPLIRRHVKSRQVSGDQSNSAVTKSSDCDHLLGMQAVTRSLILFNVLFALQTGLDLIYLWGGASLPDAMSYAEYAHRGAYPLVATALLAAGFVLVAMRPGGPAEESRLIRPLVLLWVGQNVLLVISSIYRLDLYVAAYSLTYLRLAAFIWMGLVAAGLGLILVQTILRKPNSWLITANAAMLALVLYGCCFINAPRLVASYNLDHCGAAGRTGPSLDQKYLASLAPQAIPPLEAHVEEIPALRPIILDYRQKYEDQARHRNWRAWRFRAWRLERYLTINPDTSSNPSASKAG